MPVDTAAAGCMASVCNFGDDLSRMHQVAETNLRDAPDATRVYRLGYLHAIEGVRKELPHGTPEAVTKD